MTIPSSVTSIGRWSFNNCSSLTSLTIPNSVISIGSNAFNGASNITEITFVDGNTEISLEPEAFFTLKPTKVYFGRQMDFASLDCINVETLDCSSVETIEFGEFVNEIPTGTFKECEEIRTVIAHNPVPPTTDDTFCQETYLEGVLYVPEASLDVYKAASGWGSFTNIQVNPNDNSSITTVNTDSDAEQISVEDNAICVSSDAKVSIVAMNGMTIYSGYGNCRVKVAPGIYVAIVGSTAHKLVVR